MRPIRYDSLFYIQNQPRIFTKLSKSFYELCDLARALLKAVLLKLDREQNIAGAEYFNGCTVFESDVEAKFKRGMPKAQNVYAQLKAIPRNRTGAHPKKESLKNAFLSDEELE